MTNIAEPTPEMIEAGIAEYRKRSRQNLLAPKIAAIYTAMRSSAPQEPDALGDGTDFGVTGEWWGQEPVADDDAERDLRLALWNALREQGIAQERCYPIINATVAALQAKAPETGEE